MRAATIMNRLVNPPVRMLLRSPLHRPLSGSLLLLTFTGRRTGRRYTIPVQYARWRPVVDGRTRDALVVVPGGAAGKRWWRNLVGGAPVTVRVGDHTVDGSARALADDGDGDATGDDAEAVAEAVGALRAFLARHPSAGLGLGVPRRLRDDDVTLREAVRRQVVVVVDLTTDAHDVPRQQAR